MKKHKLTKTLRLRSQHRVAGPILIKKKEERKSQINSILFKWNEIKLNYFSSFAYISRCLLLLAATVGNIHCIIQIKAYTYIKKGKAEGLIRNKVAFSGFSKITLFHLIKCDLLVI